ncbi:MAG: hypothetical protein FWF08_01760 [Oscillospiraceae bacterium]|nr:hypothetical protein [Oscillospiraceae bacterium]
MDILIIGGDSRQLYMPEHLKSKGHHVKICGVDNADGILTEKNEKGLLTAIKNAEAVILPIPCTHDGANINAAFSKKIIPFESVCRKAAEGQIFFGGMLPEDWSIKLKNKGAQVCDYYYSKAFAEKNAIPTAEGIIGILVDKMPITVSGSNVLISGFGNCGRETAKLVGALGGRVYIAARKKEARDAAKACGYNAFCFEDIPKSGGSFDAAINTVPAPVFTRETLAAINKNALIIEIASAPFGIDFGAAMEFGLKVVKAGSLPGKFAPKTAGKIICDIILKEMHQ